MVNRLLVDLGESPPGDLAGRKPVLEPEEDRRPIGLVEREDLSAANSVLQTGDNTAWAVGPNGGSGAGPASAAPRFSVC